MAGKEGEEKWRQDGIGALSGAGEEERLPHPGGLLTASGSAGREKDSGGVVGIRAEHGKWLPPGCSGPSETARVLGLSLTPVRASLVLSEKTHSETKDLASTPIPGAFITTMCGLGGVTLNAYHLLNIIFDFTEK